LGQSAALLALFVLAFAAVQSRAPAAPATPAAPLRWQPLGEPGGGGAIVALRVSPHDSRHLVASGDMLGATVSHDGGDSWEPAFGFSSYEMCDVTFHPTAPATVWLGTCMGPYKSTDGGRTWLSRREGLPPAQGGRYSAIVEKVLFDPNQPGRLLAFGGTARRWNEADSFGWIWGSLDDGEHWSHIATLSRDGFGREARKGVNLWFATYEPGSGNRVHVLGDHIGWWCSDDDGRTWRPRGPSGLPGPITGLTFHPTRPQTVWATTHNHRPGAEDAGREPGGVFVSHDAGATFVPCEGGLRKVRGGDDNENLTSWFKGVALSPANPDVLYVCDQAWSAAIVYKSTDAGQTWVPVASRGGPGAEPTETGRRAFQVETGTWAGVSLTLVADPSSPDRAYGFNSEFILRTLDGGQTWDDATAYRPEPARKDHWRGRGWTGWCSTNVAFNPWRRGQVLIQGMDGARGWLSDDDMASWRYAMGQTHPWLGGQDAGFSRDGHIYLTTGQFGQQNGIQHSRDGGQTWTTLAGAARGLPEAGWGNGPEFGGVFVHPEQGAQAWAVLGGGLLTTTDAGQTWAWVLKDIGANRMAGDPTRLGRFCVKTAGGILVTDEGREFRNLGLPGNSPRSRIHCDARGRVLVCQWREGRTGVWRYTPEIGRWDRLLDDDQAFACQADPSDPTRLLLVTTMDPFYDQACGNGVWISGDDGVSWSAANDGLPMLRANACAFDPCDPEQIVIGTYGMGFFRARWPKAHLPPGTRRYASTDEDRQAAALTPEVAAGVLVSLVVAPDSNRNLLANGDMSAGGDRPDGWTETWGAAKAFRDTTVFRSAPASLRIEVGGGTGQAFQMREGGANATLRIRGALRSQGEVRAQVAVQAFDAEWKRNEFKQVRYTQGDTDWVAFEGTVTLPAWTARYNLQVWAEGTGLAWLDDAFLAAGAASAAGSAPAPAP
jgi:hypothetical protein